MMELLKNMGDTAKAKPANVADKLKVIPEDEQPEETYTNDDLQIIINQKEVKKSKCYKLPQQKVVIK
jgi:hypothetical protein